VRYADDVYGFVKSVVCDHREAEDMSQTLFREPDADHRQYEKREVPFTAWILRVIRDAALDHIAPPTDPIEEVRTSARS
jgi:RNA polymerase sigma-70 factor (ECF subfamily)